MRNLCLSTGEMSKLLRSTGGSVTSAVMVFLLIRAARRPIYLTTGIRVSRVRARDGSNPPLLKVLNVVDRLLIISD